jgi:hypothetical protein
MKLEAIISRLARYTSFYLVFDKSKESNVLVTEFVRISPFSEQKKKNIHT